MARPPWEVALAGDSPADRRRRAATAGRATGGRVHVRPWGAAGYVAALPSRPTQTHRTLDALARALLPYTSIGLPICPACPHRSERELVELPDRYDPQGLVVWSAFASAASRSKLFIDILDVTELRITTVASADEHTPMKTRKTHRGATPACWVLLTGTHAGDYAASLEQYLRGVAGGVEGRARA